MTDYGNLTEKKAAAREELEKARQEFLKTVTAENIKGDRDKWIKFCNAKRVCAMMGVIF